MTATSATAGWSARTSSTSFRVDVSSPPVMIMSFAPVDQVRGSPRSSPSHEVAGAQPAPVDERRRGEVGPSKVPAHHALGPHPELAHLVGPDVAHRCDVDEAHLHAGNRQPERAEIQPVRCRGRARRRLVRGRRRSQLAAARRRRRRRQRHRRPAPAASADHRGCRRPGRTPGLHHGKVGRWEPVPTDVEEASSGKFFVTLLPGGPTETNGQPLASTPTRATSRPSSASWAAPPTSPSRPDGSSSTKLFAQGGKISVVDRETGEKRLYIRQSLPASSDYIGGALYATTDIFGPSW